MPDPRQMRRPKPDRKRILGLAAMVALGLVTAAAGAPSDVYYERALMSAADGRCRLFTPDIAAALTAGEAQARGAALRAGTPSAALGGVAARAAAKAGGLPCSSPDLKTAAARVRTGFAGYSRLSRMTFPGDVAAWRADRTLPRSAPAWRLAQTAPLAAGQMTFGLVGTWSRPSELVAVADFGQGQTPYAARLLVRDPALAPAPYLNVLQAGAAARLPLDARTPPRAASAVFAADAMAPADLSLQASGSAMAFRFPAAAIGAIAALDPREAVTVEFLFQGRSGDMARRAFIEVGDFAAGRAFLAVAR